MIDRQKLQDLENKLKNNSLIKDEYLHLYIDAHILFDSIKNLLKKFLYENFGEEVKNIKKKFNNNKKIMNDRINGLKNKKFCPNTALTLNFKECFYNNYCLTIETIKDEIENFLNKNIELQ